MINRSRAPFRVFRTSVGVLVVLTVAGVAHCTAGGALPPPLILSLIAALTALGATLVSRWRLRAPAMLLLLGGAQWVLHQAFTLLSADPAHSMQGTATTHLHHEMGNESSASLHSALDSASSNSASSSVVMNHDSSAMMIFHAAALIVSVLLLSYGEALLWAIARWMWPLPHVDSIVSVPRIARPQSVPEVPLLKKQNVFSVQRRRGPPLRIALPSF